MLTVLPRRFNGEQSTVVLNVYVDDADVDVPLTADEAVTLAMALIKAAQDVRGPRHAPRF